MTVCPQNDPIANPLSSFIRLGKDAQRRRQTLVAMKERMVTRADQLIRTRNHQLNLLRPFKASSQRENDQGDFFCLNADAFIFKEATSAREAYDALMFTMATMEISFTEKSGEITVREEYDALKDGVGNFRIRSWENSVAPTDSNLVVFTHFFENRQYDDSSDDQGYSVTVVDYVDEDDLYPYRSDESIRRDITSAFVISTQRKTKKNLLTGEIDVEPVVAIQRAVFLKIHNSNLIQDDPVLDAVREVAAGGCDIVVDAMREYVVAARNSPMSSPESLCGD